MMVGWYAESLLYCAKTGKVLDYLEQPLRKKEKFGPWECSRGLAW
jgi:hypothetical protein